jgi:hypothetical protein
MSTPEELHTPTPAFVAGLEDAVLRAHREADTTVISIAPRHRWHDWGRIAAVLALGAALGVGAQIASAQVRDSKTRSEIERSLLAERDLAAFRLDIAKQEHKRVSDGFAAGTVPKQALRDAEAEKRALEVAVQRIELDLAEVGASNTAPRNELWAPSFGGRDFVRERLQLEASLAQERNYAAEGNLMEVERRQRLGVESTGVLLDAQQRVTDTQRDLGFVAIEMLLRDKQKAERMTPESITRERQRLQLDLELRRATQLHSMAKSRLATAEKGHKVGVVTELDLKRAQLDVLEREVMLKRLQFEIQRTRAKQG